MKTYQNKQSFTLIEFIFIVLVIAIISSVAINKLSNSNLTSAFIFCKTDFHNINLAIKNKTQENNLKNINNNFNLENNDILFSNIIKSFDSRSWTKVSNSSYKYNLDDKNSIIFQYNSINKTFICNKSKDLCKKVLN